MITNLVLTRLSSKQRPRLRETANNCRHENAHGEMPSACSEDPLRLGVDLLEGAGSALVEDGFGRKALIFIVVVCVHTVSKCFQISLAESIEDHLSG